MKLDTLAAAIEIDNETTRIHAEEPETNDLGVPIATAERTP